LKSHKKKHRRLPFFVTAASIPPTAKSYRPSRARTIKRYWPGVVNWAEKRITNGIIESFNPLLQAAKAKARGYRKTETLKVVIYLLAGKLDFDRANPFCATHTLLYGTILVTQSSKKK